MAEVVLCKKNIRQSAECFLKLKVQKFIKKIVQNFDLVCKQVFRFEI